ncbi:MAG TPA: CGNR zinc finger domain-containing protein [Solirubrobacteraceae bacterium]|nr:CGNR zinc finger domain-containing protein [Solirubrobacteraceae bacterium]
MARDQAPPHGLDQVIDFVNTRDIDRGTDALGSASDLRAWLAAHGHRGASRATAADLEAAHALREALRAVLLAHNGATPDSAAAAVLDGVAQAGGLGVRFGRDGAELVAGGGVTGALANLLIPVVRAGADGSWPRVKACLGEGCAWAFYDRSRNRSGRWCDMTVCGNRAKVRTYRGRRAG